MRTLHLCWPALDERAEAHLRSAQHALGRLSPLVARSGGRIEVGIDGLRLRSGSEEQIATAALRATRLHIRALPLLALASSRLAAAIAATPGSELARAAGTCVTIPHGRERLTLAPLPVAWLRLAAVGRPADDLTAAIARCELLGIRTLGTLAQMQSGELAARIGMSAEALVTVSRGGDVELIPPMPLPRRMLARAAFDLPLTSLEELRFPLRRALDELLTCVVRDGAAVGIVRLSLARERNQPLRIVVRLPLPTANRAQIERLLLAALDRIVVVLQAHGLEHDGIVGLQLRFEDVLPATGEQLTLLGARSARRDRLAWSTAAIAIRYGVDRVLTGEVLDPDDARADRRFRLRRSHPEVSE